MKAFIVFAAFVACAFAGTVDLTKNGLATLLAEHGGMIPMLGGRIVGGDPISINSAPWAVSLQQFGSHQCAGVIISATRVLSAAHCFSVDLGDWQVRAGSTLSNSGGQIISFQFANIIFHPQYNSQTRNNDICVARLSASLNTAPAGVAVIPMPAQDAGTAAGTNALVVGWGAICEGCAWSTQLRGVTVPVVANNQCNTMYNGGITDQMLCAGFATGGRDACQGDSGGPLTAGGQVIGIVSWGMGCARPNFPGVYARVSSFRTWINGLM